MPKDYANRPDTTSPSRHRRTARSGSDRRHPSNAVNRSRTGNKNLRRSFASFAWSAFAGGIVLGATSSLAIVWLASGWTSEKAVSASTDPGQSKVNEATGVPATQFEFYDLLRQDPGFADPRGQSFDPNAPEHKAGQGSKRPDQKRPAVEYLLQAGSFLDQEDAQKLRARLLLLGLQTHISEYRAEGGALWHRVVVGPFHENLLAHRATTTLRENGVNPLPLTRTLP